MAFTFSCVIDETHRVERTYGHRLNGDFFLLSSFPFQHDYPQRHPASPMEDSMCWEMDYRFFAEQKKAQENRITEGQRAGVIDKLLSEANRQSESADATPVKEAAPAK